MVISSSPARSKLHSLSAATRSTTSTGFSWRSLVNSIRDMPPPHLGSRKESGRTRERCKQALCRRPPADRPGGRITGADHYTRFGPGGQNGKMGFIEDSQVLETSSGAARAERKFLNQSNRLETDSSAAVRPIASPIRVAIDSTRMLRATRTASVGWIESVITSSLRREGIGRGAGRGKL